MKKFFINLSVEEFVRTFVKLKKNMQDLMLSLILIFMVQHSILNGDERHNQFSNQGEDEPTGAVFAIFDRQDFSRVRCGILCLDDQCCEEFLYSASTRRCIGRHVMWFSSSSSDNAVYTTYEGMTSYKKGSYSHSVYPCANLEKEFGINWFGPSTHSPHLKILKHIIRIVNHVCLCYLKYRISPHFPFFLTKHWNN